MPRFQDLDWRGLETFGAERYAAVTQMDREDWRSELALHDELFGKIGAHLPKTLEARRGRMHEKLAA